MSDYTPSGKPGFSGAGSSADIRAEFSAIQTAVNSKANATNGSLASPTINGGAALTATSTELNVLDGITSTTSELNTMHGVTATTAQINYLVGVTSGIQAQIDTKAPTANPTFTGIISAPTISLYSNAAHGLSLNSDYGTSFQVIDDGLGNATLTANAMEITINSGTFTANSTVARFYSLYTGGGIRINNTGAATFTTVSGRQIHGVLTTTASSPSPSDTQDIIICDRSAGTVTLNLVSPIGNTGKEIVVKTTQNQAVVSSASDVVPLAGGAPGTAILTNTAGKWAQLISDGTNWVIMAAN